MLNVTKSYKNQMQERKVTFRNEKKSNLKKRKKRKEKKMKKEKKKEKERKNKTRPLRERHKNCFTSTRSRKR